MMIHHSTDAERTEFYQRKEALRILEESRTCKAAAKSVPRRKFDLAIVIARYRWEFLRRNPDYQKTAQRWVKIHKHTCLKCKKGEGCLELSAVVPSPVYATLRLSESEALALGFEVRDLERLNETGDKTEKKYKVNPPLLRSHYARDCKRWGLRLLIPPALGISEEEMAAYPIFTDTPSRQPFVKDRAALRARASRLPDHAAGRPSGTAKELLEELNQEERQRVQQDLAPADADVDISERDLRRYFHTHRLDPGPFQIKKQRKHFAALDLCLEVFDRREKRESFARISRGLRITDRRARQIWETALRGTGETFGGWMDWHSPACPVCAEAARGSLSDARYCRETKSRIRGLGAEALSSEVMRRLLKSRPDLTSEAKQLQKHLKEGPANVLRQYLLSGNVSGVPSLVRNTAEVLDLLAAGREGTLPAKRAEKMESDRQWKNVQISPSLFPSKRR